MRAFLYTVCVQTCLLPACTCLCLIACVYICLFLFGLAEDGGRGWGLCVEDDDLLLDFVNGDVSV